MPLTCTLNNQSKVRLGNVNKILQTAQEPLIIVVQDKVAHLNQIKSKLESTLDELESSLEKEKRGRANVEKERRKVEGDLKVTQESVADQERSKKELESSIERKEKDASVLLSKLDDEQSLVAKIQKGIKVLNHPHMPHLLPI